MRTNLPNETVSCDENPTLIYDGTAAVVAPKRNLQRYLVRCRAFRCLLSTDYTVYVVIVEDELGDVVGSYRKADSR